MKNMSMKGDAAPIRARIAWIDDAKGVAAWMVVTAHLLRRGILTDYLAATAVAVFFLLAGVTFHSYRDVRGRMTRLWSRIVVPYLVVGLISIGIYQILGGFAAATLRTAGGDTSFLQDLGHLFYASSVGTRMKWNESLWFLPCYCLVVLIAELLERAARGRIALTALLYAAAGLLGYAMISRGWTGFPWHLETALLVMPLFGAGRMLPRSLKRNNDKVCIMLLTGVAGVLAGTGIFVTMAEEMGERSFSLRAVHLADPLRTYAFLLLLSGGMVTVVWALAHRQKGSLLSRVGACSLQIVLWNKFPVVLLQVLLRKCCPAVAALFMERSTAQALLIALLAAIPCMLLCLVWTKFYQQMAVLLRAHHHIC